jgi:hypothetical protein
MGPGQRVPQHLHFGGGAEESAIHPLIAVYLLIAVVLILVTPRRKAITPFLIPFFTIPIGQVLVLAGFHFTALRILILAGLARWAISPKTSSGGKKPRSFNGADWAVVLWSISATIAFCLEYRETQAIVKAMGTLLDTLGGFLVVRFLIPDGEALRRTVKTLAAICVILAVCMVNEFVTHKNVFGYVGGIEIQAVMRNGHVRAGATLGYLYAGAFAGVLIPLFLWLWREKKSRMVACAGLVGATAMVITTTSSTSYMAFMGSLLGLAFWPLRNRMRIVRWGLVTILVALHLVMKAPVWALIQRIDLTGSSSGSQRYQLVDMTIRHFSEWWLVGTNAYIAWGWSSWDLCNQFVAVALTGGLLSLIFYIAIFGRSFAAIGTARKLANGDRNQEWLLWCLGSSLFATVVAHFGINYMAQLIMGFFPLVVCASVAAFEVSETAVQTSEVPVREQFLSAGGAARNLPLGKAKQKARYGLSSRLKERFTP